MGTMRYVIADLDGRSQAYFDTHEEVRSALLDMLEEDATALGDLYVVAYNDDGERAWGPETAAQVAFSTPLDWSGLVSAVGPTVPSATTTTTSGTTTTLPRAPKVRPLAGASR
jgi:hypothetical protein